MERRVGGEGGVPYASINFLSDLDNICHRWDAITNPVPFHEVETGPSESSM